MSDRDDALRRDLGWTGPEDTDFEPPRPEPAPAATPPRTPSSRPPVDYVPSHGVPSEPVATDSEPVDPEPPTAYVQQPETPPRFGPPPGTPRDTGSLSAQRPDGPPPWDGRTGPPPGPPAPPSGWQPNRGPRPSGPGPSGPGPGGPGQFGPGQFGQPPGPGGGPGSGPAPMGPGPMQPWPGPGYGPDSRVSAPPPSGSYADRIRPDDLMRPRRAEPGRGWRRVLLKATFGLVNLGPSADELHEAELVARIRAALRGHYKIGVMGKGGVGKTTVSASIGSVFAELRQDDRVVAVDADTAFGKLGARVDPKAMTSYWELAGDEHLDTFADIRNRVGNNAAGLFVLAGEATPARRRVLDPAIYREATSRLDRYFSISIVDCSSTMDTPVTQEVLRDLDALVVVSSPWVDGAAAAGQTMDWLAHRGLNGLLQRTVVVLNDSDGHADKRTRTILAQQFAGQGQAVVEVPFDGGLRPGGVIAGTREMSPATRRRFVEIAAVLAGYFPGTDDRSRDRH